MVVVWLLECRFCIWCLLGALGCPGLVWYWGDCIGSCSNPWHDMNTKDTKAYMLITKVYGSVVYCTIQLVHLTGYNLKFAW